MASLTEEARRKLKAIMTAKLTELIGHCEPVLPDYVVSMLTNNKTKEYMKMNLEVFIGDKAGMFSDWLVDLKEKISASSKAGAPVAQCDKPKPSQEDIQKCEIVEKTKAEEEDTSRKRKRDDRDTDHADKRSSRADIRRNSRERKRSLSHEHNTGKRSSSRDRSRTKKRSPSPDRHAKKRTLSGDRNARSRSSSPNRLLNKKTRQDGSHVRNRRDPSSFAGDVERGVWMADKKVASTVVIHSSDSSLPKTVSSTVTVKRKVIPDSDSMAKSRSNMFLKAVNEASRSTATTKDDAKESVEIIFDDDNTKRSVATKKVDGPTVTVRLDLGNGPSSKMEVDVPAPKKKNVEVGSEEMPEYQSEKSSSSYLKCSSRSSTPRSSPKKRVDENEAAIDAFIAAANLELAIKRAETGREDILLDEDEIRALQQRRDEEDTHMDTDFAKPKTRCFYWPNCKNGDACPFIHPSVPCTKFPRCPFGKQCYFIHPPCRFQENCKNPNCSAIHGDTKEIAVLKKILGIKPSTSTEPNNSDAVTAEDRSQKTFCRYGSECHNLKCFFRHPALCMYGMSCTNSMCTRRHLSVVGDSSSSDAALGGDKYTWKASI